MKDTVIRNNLTVEDIAAKNSRIDVRLFREWQKKMAVIESVNVRVGSEHKQKNSEPKQSQSIPLRALKF